MKDYIKQHRQERDRLLGMVYVEREGLQKARGYLKNDLIKIITGPRRAGKSIFALMMLKHTNFAYVNFDDEALKSVLQIGNYDDLWGVLDEVYPDNRYILFDEIQNLKDWELFVNKSHRRGRNLILTGSNAKLLSGEWATALTGRTIEFEVWPFSFSEYLLVKKGGTVLDYLQTGGFPEVVTKSLEAREYAQGLVNSILIKDITTRHNINRQQLLLDLNQYLSTQFTCDISYSNLAKIFGLSSANTIQKYVGYLQNPYLYFLLDRFHFKTKMRITSSKKLYLIDTAFAPLGISADTGKLLENAVFLSLLKVGFEPNRDQFYFKTKNGKEIDFVIKKNHQIAALLQVCLQLENPKTLAREVSALHEAGRELNCQRKIIITQEIQKNLSEVSEIEIIKANDWLLNPSVK